MSLQLGFDLPLAHLEHQYALTGEVAALKSLPGGGADVPAIFDHDSSFYMRVHK